VAVAFDHRAVSPEQADEAAPTRTKPHMSVPLDPLPALSLAAPRSPLVQAAGVVHAKPGASFTEHSYGVHQLVLMSSGHADGWRDRRHYTLSPGHAYLYHPGERLRATVSGTDEFICRFVIFDWPRGVGGERLELPPSCPLDPSLAAELTQAFTGLHEAWLDGAPGWTLHACAQLLRMLSGIAKASAPGVDQRMARAMAFLEQHIRDRVRISEAAAVAGLNTAYFARAFRRATGMAPMRWLMRLRLEEARRLLLGDEALPIADVAARAGFDDGD
jgi:AraC-like DNA-binding protein